MLYFWHLGRHQIIISRHRIIIRSRRCLEAVSKFLGGLGEGLELFARLPPQMEASGTNDTSRQLLHA